MTPTPLDHRLPLTPTSPRVRRYLWADEPPRSDVDAELEPRSAPSLRRDAERGEGLQRG